MAQIPKETIDKVVESTDIVDLINSYIPLKRAGSAYKANCPFHNEKTASFNVSPQRQTYHCFGCQKHGNVIGFVMDYEGLPFVEAVRKLAARAGVLVIEQAMDPRAEQEKRTSGKLKDVNREVAEFLHSLLLTDPEAAHAREYLKSRGFGREMAVRWKLGWMPRNPQVFKDWAKSRKFTGRELFAAGVAGMKEEGNPKAGIFIRFNDRLMFPICNDMGDVIAFSGRVLREDQKGGKYQNSPETAIFKKSNVLFALDRAKKAILKEKAVLLCEGQIDAICCHEQGVEHAVAPLGTAFTPQHAKILRRYASAAVLCYDADGAGLAASKKAFAQLAAEGMSARMVELPPGDDPDSFLKAHGLEAFRRRIAEAKDFFLFKLDHAKASGLLDSASSQIAVANDCIDLLAAMSDPVAFDNQVNVVAEHLRMPAERLRAGVATARKRKKRLEPTDGAELAAAEVVPTPLHRNVQYLCHLALSSGSAQHFLAEQFETIHEAQRWLEGIPLLEGILAAAPDPASHVAVNGYLAGLKEEDRRALVGSEAFPHWEEQDALAAAENALSLLSSIVLQRRAAAIKAEQMQAGLQPARIAELMMEAKEIALLLKRVGRIEFDDQLPASTWKAKEPEWKKKWKKG